MTNAPLFIAPPLVSWTYAVAAHLFLAFFHERRVSKRKYWFPILIRCGYCLLCGCLAWCWWQWSEEESCRGLHKTNRLDEMDGIGSCRRDDAVQDQSFFRLRYVTVPSWVGLVNGMLSIYFIWNTRRNEVDGPPPPYPTSNNTNGDGSHRHTTIRVISVQNKVILITGANTGIGLETARQLYHRGGIIVFACRSRERATEAMASVDPRVLIVNNNDNISSKNGAQRMHFLPLDLTSKSSIRMAAKLFLEMGLPLHILINNAGVMRQRREETVDGLEMTMAANHFGHFLLTNLLLPKLRQTAWEEKYPSKVITLSSSLYAQARRHSKQNGLDHVEFGIDLDDLQCQKKRYTLFDQYSQSKLANILFARELGRRETLRARSSHHSQSLSANHAANGVHCFCPIQSYSLHPGLVRTNVVRDMPWYLYYPNIVFAFFLAVLQKTPRAGAYTSVFCAVVDDFRMTTEEEENYDREQSWYFVNSEICELSDAATRDEDARKLWELSCDLMEVPLEE
eukprot:CCRYP_014890-RB/>CCRYP_014890-RB protein AED:0.04 eAED:0.04 QI:171/1/1/1/0.87/0.66/9/3085/509